MTLDGSGFLEASFDLLRRENMKSRRDINLCECKVT